MLAEEDGEAGEATQEPMAAVEAIGLTEAMAAPREGAEATGADRNRTICNIQM